MSEKADRVEDLSREDTARLVMDMFHRIIIHYSLWFTEVRHQMGMEKALDTLKIASDRSIGIRMSGIVPGGSASGLDNAQHVKSQKA